MTISHLLVLIARLFAIMIAVAASNHFIFNLITVRDGMEFPVLPLVYFGAFALIGLLVWFLPYSFVRLLTGYRGEFQTKKEPVSAEQFARVIFGALAIYLLFKVVSDAAFWLSFYHALNSNPDYLHLELSSDNKAAIMATAVEALFVLILVLGRKRLLSIFLQLRKS